MQNQIRKDRLLLLPPCLAIMPCKSMMPTVGLDHAFQHVIPPTALTIAACLGLFFMGEPFLRLLIGHGGITAENVHVLWWIMVALSGLLIGGCTGQVTSGAFYAMGDTRTPTMLFIVTYTVYIPIKIIVFLRYGVIGLAATTSLHLIINFLIQLVLLEMTHLPREA